MQEPFSRAKKILVCLCLVALAPAPAWAFLPWGTPLGSWQLVPEAPSVIAFSNGNWEWYPRRLSGYGKKWQCVEFVNRVYAEVYGLNIEGGDAKHYFKRAAAKGLIAFPNGSSTPPQPGDIVCSEGEPYGHVALVRSVAEDGVHIIQQNWFNDERDLDMVLQLNVEGGHYRLEGFGADHPVCGWLRAPEALSPEEQRVVPVNSPPPPATAPGRVASSSS